MFIRGCSKIPEINWTSIILYYIFVVIMSIGESLAADDHSDNCQDEEKLILQNVFHKYDKSNLPSRNGVLVEIEMHIQDISSLSELTSDFELDVFISSIWHDPHLSYEHIPTCETNLTLDLTYLKKIWLPKTCVINSKRAEVHSSPTQNTMLILYKNGTLWLNYRMKLRAPCQIDLRTFPFDSQSCFLIVESYSYNNQRVKLAWLPQAPLTFMKQMELPDFVLTSWNTYHATLEYPNGFWDQLNATFTFKRRYGFFVLQAYTPTYMTIFVSWISFFMDPRQISARATLGISAFLAMTFQFGTILKNQPPVSYIKSVDVWMLSGIMIMFATLAELAIVSYMQRSCVDVPVSSSESPTSYAATPRISALRYAMSVGDLPTTCNNHTGAATGVMVAFRLKQKLTPSMIDRIAMIVLPSIFFTFNICYWTYHLILT